MAKSAAARDCAFLILAVVLSFAWYVGGLGFYSDDWAFLGEYATASDQSIGGLFTATNSPLFAMRPVQIWLNATLFWLFGAEPLGYHLFNGALLAANAVLLYGVVRETLGSRTIALAIALVFALLPSYATVRFWYAAFMITLSIASFLASAYADLKAATAPVLRQGIRWKALAIVCLIVSGLAYEVALPLFLVVPFLMLWRVRREAGDVPRDRRVYVAGLVIVNLVLLVGICAYKLHMTVRLGAAQGLAAQVVEIIQRALRIDVPEGDYGLNVAAAVRVHFWDYGLNLLGTAVALARAAPASYVWLAGAFWVFAFVYLMRACDQDRWPSARAWAALVPAGLMIFALGYAIFLTNYNVQFSPTGIANRTGIAAALGAASCITGCIGWSVTWLRVRPLVTAAFAALVAFVAGCSVLIVNVIAERWVAAYRIERTVLASIQQRFPAMPPGITLLLDGVCPYAGPAIVFEANWDLTGALKTIYGDIRLAADVVTPRLSVGDDGITTTIYGTMTKTYPYGDSLLVYDARRGVAQPLPDRATARAYFDQTSGSRECPPGREGIGVRMF